MNSSKKKSKKKVSKRKTKVKSPRRNVPRTRLSKKKATKKNTSKKKATKKKKKKKKRCKKKVKKHGKSVTRVVHYDAEGANVGGRPTEYDSSWDLQAYKLCLLGAIDKELADFFCICEKTLNTYKKKHPSFLQSIRNGKDLADANVAESLYLRAIGYSHPEAKVLSHQGEHTETVVVDKLYPPDVQAGSFWLTNRQREKWKNRNSNELGGPNDGPIESITRTIIDPLAKDDK